MKFYHFLWVDKYGKQHVDYVEAEDETQAIERAQAIGVCVSNPDCRGRSSFYIDEFVSAYWKAEEQKYPIARAHYDSGEVRYYSIK